MIERIQDERHHQLKRQRDKHRHCVGDYVYLIPERICMTPLLILFWFFPEVQIFDFLDVLPD